MAKILKDGLIQTENGRILFADSFLSLRELVELVRLITPGPMWPFVSGGGSSSSPDGPDGIQGPQGFMGSNGGPQGSQGNQGNRGNQGAQGSQGNRGNQAQVGAITSSLFEFNHTSGSSSTGALGFTPLFCVYTGAIVTDPSLGPGVTRAVGFARGTGALAKSAAIGVQDQGSSEVDCAGAGGDTSAIGGDVTQSQDPTLITAFLNSLNVTAFGSGGITLTWEAAVLDHVGKLMVVGIP